MNPFDVIKQRMQLGYYRSTFHCMTEIFKAEGLRAFYISFPTTLMTNIPYGCVVVAANESAKKFLNPSGQHNIPASLLAGCIAGGVAAAATTPLDVIKTRLQTQDLVPCVELSGGGNGASPPVCAAEKKYSHTPSTTSPYVLNSSAMKYHTRSDLQPSFVNSPSSASAQRSGVLPRSFRLLSENFAAIADVARRILSEEGYRGFWRGVGPRVVSQAPAVAISWTVYESAKTALKWQPST